jgi:hypothetical protein
MVTSRDEFFSPLQGAFLSTIIAYAPVKFLRCDRAFNLDMPTDLQLHV